MKVKAAVCHEIGKPLVVDELDLDRGPQEAEVLVRWEASGVCHSDLHAMNGYFGFPTPFIPGHEGGGIVEEVGPSACRVKVGDHVVSILLGSCGQCRFCLRGQPTLCERERALPDATTPFRKAEQPVGRFGPHQLSTFAEYCLLPERNVQPIREDALLEAACLLGCCAYSGAGPVFNRTKVELGSRVVVFGCGGLGLAGVNAAKLSGALQVIAVDIVPQKLEWAKKFGANDVIDSRTEDPVERVAELTGGLLADFAFEYVGLEQTMQQAIASVGPRGTVVVMGVAKPGTTLTLDPEQLLSQKVITGSGVGSGVPELDVPMLVDMYMANGFMLGDLVTHRLRLEEINKAFDLMRSGEAIRSVIVY
jgi:S-(hydroxymethyl)glutathione dehydrogenase/alcohol dehydrogenase